MDKTEEEAYMKAGKIAAQTLNEIRRKVQPGISYQDVCNTIENRIRELGGEPAFPVNICINEIAAHDTAEIDDVRKVRDRDLVKLDIGVHVNGFIADTATTINFNEDYADMTNVNLEVLNLALRKVRAGEYLNEIGRTVYYFTIPRGYKPISNLSGHSLGQYQIHAGDSIPNVPVNGFLSRFSSGNCYAIETFLTSKNASAYVNEIDQTSIFRIVKRKKLKDPKADLLLDKIWEMRKSLPFATRWFTDFYDKKDLISSIDYLVKNKIIHAYHVLKEETDQIVSQFEHTLLVMEKNAVITTA